MVRGDRNQRCPVNPPKKVFEKYKVPLKKYTVCSGDMINYHIYKRYGTLYFSMIIGEFFQRWEATMIMAPLAPLAPLGRPDAPIAQV